LESLPPRKVATVSGPRRRLANGSRTAGWPDASRTTTMKGSTPDAVPMVANQASAKAKAWYGEARATASSSSQPRRDSASEEKTSTRAISPLAAPSGCAANGALVQTSGCDVEVMASKLIGGVNKILTAYYRLSIRSGTIADCIDNFHIYGIESPRPSFSTSRGTVISAWPPARPDVRFRCRRTP
jgi:hypothetical protein